jgi:hypothetical protein
MTAPPIIPNGRYQDYKGKVYRVIGLACHTETLEWLVVYRAVFGDTDLWVRPAEMFVETIEVDGKQVKRFEFVGV